MFYAQRPYIYLIGGVAAVCFRSQSKLAFYCGLILIACGIWVLLLRTSHKIRNEDLRQKHKDLNHKIQGKETYKIDD